MTANFSLNIIKAGLFALLLVPFIHNSGFYFPFVGLKGIYFMAVAEVVFFIWIFFVFKHKQRRANLKNPVIAALLLFLAISFASAIFGASFSTSFWSKFERMSGVLMLCHLVAVCVVLASVFCARDYARLFFASVGLAVIAGVMAIADKRPEMKGGGLLGNDSFLGMYLLFNIFIAIFLFFSKLRTGFFGGRLEKLLKIGLAAAIVILVFCLLFANTKYWFWADFGASWNAFIMPDNWWTDVISSGARAAKISLIVGLGLLGMLRLATMKAAVLRFFGRSMLLAAFISGVAVVFLSVSPGNFIHNAVQKEFSEGTIRGRLLVWEVAWKGFLDKPSLGWGPENFDLAFVKYYNPCFGAIECSQEIWYDRAHNVVFDTLATTGIVGLMSYLALFGAALYVLWKKYFTGAIGFAEAGVFTALLAAYFVQNLTVFDMITSLMMFFLVLGFIASLDKPAENDGRWSKSFPLWKTGAIVLAFIICFQSFVIGPYNADRNVILAAQSPFGSQQRIDLYKKTFAASPMGEFQIRLFFAQKWLEAVQGGTIGQLNVEQINREFSFLTGELEKSRSQVLSDFKSRLMLGQLYNAWTLYDPSKLSLADKALGEAKALAPQNQQSYWNLAQTRLYQRDIAGALKLAQEAYDLYPTNAQAKTVLDQIKEIQNKVNGGK